MKEGTRNHYGANCRHCGNWVAAGAGIIVRAEREGEDGYRWLVEHAEDCPTEVRASTSERPEWAVRAEGKTPAGLDAEGYRFVVSDTRPDDAAVPLNEPARDIVRHENGG